MNQLSAAIETIADKLPGIELRRSEPMKNHTSFKIGGPVAAMFFPKSAEDLVALCALTHELGIKPLIIGNGSNLLVEDAALDLVVIKTGGGLNNIRMTGAAELTAESGVLLSKLAVYAQEHALSGLEFAHGIPGTLGGAVTMNAGAYGGEIKDVVTKTISVKPGQPVCETPGADHDFSYRHSKFSDTEDIILSCVISLTPGDADTIRNKMDELSKKRRDSQPLNLPSAGSTFKRPQNGYAASLIDQAGLKGFTIGGAAVSDKHAGFVVNLGGATFSDVMAVMQHVQDTVLKKFGVALEPEVKIIRNVRH